MWLTSQRPSTFSIRITMASRPGSGLPWVPRLVMAADHHEHRREVRVQILRVVVGQHRRVLAGRALRLVPGGDQGLFIPFLHEQ